MTATTSISLFCQWLLAETPDGATACTIVLHGCPDCVNVTLIEAITEYLNEYDGDAAGLWLNATPDLIQKIATDPSHRRLIGIDPNAPADSNDSTKVLAALNQRGHVVCLAPGDSSDGLKLHNAFHAGISRNEPITEPCHLILNPDLIQEECLPRIIGDVFLEWLSSLCRSQQALNKRR